MAAIYLFKISGPDGGTWTADLKSTPAHLRAGRARHPAVHHRGHRRRLPHHDRRRHAGGDAAVLQRQAEGRPAIPTWPPSCRSCCRWLDSSPWRKSDRAENGRSRPGCKARGGRILLVFNRRATQQTGWLRPFRRRKLFAAGCWRAVASQHMSRRATWVGSRRWWRWRRGCGSLGCWRCRRCRSATSRCTASRRTTSRSSGGSMRVHLHAGVRRAARVGQGYGRRSAVPEAARRRLRRHRRRGPVRAGTRASRI